jgi:hypothetical protein
MVALSMRLMADQNSSIITSTLPLLLPTAAWLAAQFVLFSV